MVLTEENYYSAEADAKYMSVSQFKSFSGTYGRVRCEHAAYETLMRRWHEEPTTAMLVGSYVDEYFQGTLDRFKADNPQIFKRDGELKAEYQKANRIIERIERDAFFMKYLSGEKQVIMTADLFGTPWKIKMDSYFPGVGIVDLKIMSSAIKRKWVKDLGYIDFIEEWGYDIQGAIYQKVVEINTGKKLPFRIAVATKEEEPDIWIIRVEQARLDAALTMVEFNMPRILEVKSGHEKPDRCEMCNCCRATRVLKHEIHTADLPSDF